MSGLLKSFKAIFFQNRNIHKRKDKYLFVIGFNKTGTTSIHRLFQKSGYRSVHWDEGKLARKMLDNTLQGRPVLEGYHHEFDVYSDMVFRNSKFHFEGNSLFKQLHADYPNACFLYNARDIDEWVLSRVNHPNNVGGLTELNLQQRLFQTDNVEVIKTHWKGVRKRYEEDLALFFSGKDNFLALDIADGRFVEKLSDFCGFELAAEHWSQHNKTQ